MTTDATVGIQQHVPSRPELARQLLARADRLAPRLGDISFAAELQLLKRELARGHRLLSSPEDTNYLSVVTLVEGALASLTWKKYTPQILDALRLAFSAGTHEAPFTFEQYNAIRQHFKTSGIAIGPILELTPSTLESEDEDGKEA
jgi:hypothetical protein